MAGSLVDPLFAGPGVRRTYWAMSASRCETPALLNPLPRSNVMRIGLEHSQFQALLNLHDK